MRRDDEQVEQTVDRISLGRALATQSDLSPHNRLCRETWYGHHSPCLRLVCFIVLSSFMSMMGTLLQFQLIDIPILQTMTNQQLDEMRQTHQDCFEAVCDAARTLDFDCLVHADGTSARVDYETYTGPFTAPIPAACHVAVKKTLGNDGLRYLREVEKELLLQNHHYHKAASPLYLFSIVHDDNDAYSQQQQQQQEKRNTKPLPDRVLDTSDNTQETQKQQRQHDDAKTDDINKQQQPRALFRILPQCALEISLGDVISITTVSLSEAAAQSNWTGSTTTGRRHLEQHSVLPLVHLASSTPNERKSRVLQQQLCPKEEEEEEVLDEEEEEEVTYMSAFKMVYDWILTHRFLLIGKIIFFVRMIINWASLCWLSIRLILPTLVVRSMLPWPQDSIGHKQITFWSIYKMLLLLCTLTLDRDGGELGDALLIFFLMAIAALYYKDKKAAWAWLDLAMAWFGAPYIYPLLNKACDTIALFDALNIVQLVGSFIGYFVIGDGWWKLVTLVAFYRAYPLRDRVFGPYLSWRRASRHDDDQAGQDITQPTHHTKQD